MLFLDQFDPYAIRLPTFSAFGRSFDGVGIHWYGLMYLMGFLAAWWLGRRRVRAGRLPGVTAEGFGDLMFYGMLGVVLGGRIGYMVFYATSELLANPLSLFKVWEGGMSFHGGLLGVVVAMAWWSRRHALHVFDTVDFVAPLVPPGLFFGRLGNFINGELWGKPTGGDWGVVFPMSLPEPWRSLDAASLRAAFDAGQLTVFARHPSQLYEAGLEGVVLFTVLWCFSRVPRHRYAVSGLFALLYGVFRFLIEFVRLPDADLGYLAFGWLTMGQVLSLPLIALGLFLLWKSHSSPTLQPAVAGGRA